MGRRKKLKSCQHPPKIKTATSCGDLDGSILGMEISEEELPNILHLQSLPFTQCKLVLSLREGEGEEYGRYRPEGTKQGWKREGSGFVFYDGITLEEREELRSQLPKLIDMIGDNPELPRETQEETAGGNMPEPEITHNLIISNWSARPRRKVKSIYQRRDNDNHPSHDKTPLIGKNTKVVANGKEEDGRPPHKFIDSADWQWDKTVEANIDMKQRSTEESHAPPVKIFRCPYCFKTFVDGLSLISHLPIHTAVHVPPNDQEQGQGQPNGSRSNLESAKLFQKLGMEIVGTGPNRSKVPPIKREKDGGQHFNFKCSHSHCTRSFQKMRGLRMHVTRLHKRKRTVTMGQTIRKCGECKFSNNARFHLTNHARLHTEEGRVHHCLRCSCSFRTAKNLRIHEKRFCKNLVENLPTRRRAHIAPTEDSKKSLMSTVKRAEAIVETPKYNEKLAERVKDPFKILTSSRIKHGKLMLTRCDSLLKQYGLLPNGSKVNLDDQGLKPNRSQNKVPSSFENNIVEITLEDQLPPTGKLWKCKLCDKMFSQLENAQRHLKTIHSGFMILCPKCPATYARKDRMRSHLISKHHFEESQVLKMFPRRAPTGAISRDSTKKNPPRIYNQGHRHKCSHCAMTFRLPVYLRRHVNMIHLGMKKHICPGCDKAFRDAHALKMHLMSPRHQYHARVPSGLRTNPVRMTQVGQI